MPHAPMPTETRVDPVTLEIIRGSLASTIHDMELLMERCAMSPFIKEKKDYFVGVFDTRGRIVACHIWAAARGCSIRSSGRIRSTRCGRATCTGSTTRTSPTARSSTTRTWSSPSRSSTRTSPSRSPSPSGTARTSGIAGGEHLAARDGDLPRGRARPPVRIVREGQLNEEAYLIFLRNSRLPGLVEGHARHDGVVPPGGDAPRRAVHALRRPDRARGVRRVHRPDGARARELFLALVPEGAWSFHDYLDSDGGAEARRYRIELALDRVGDHVRLDGSRSDDQARGPINFMTNPGLLRIAFGRYLQSLDPELEVNEGLLRNLDEWVTREGSILKPRFPAPLGMRANTRFRVMSCIFGSLAQANGGRVPAGSPVYVLYYFRAWDQARNAPILCIEGLGVGLGARPFADGVDVIYYIAQENDPVEYVERDFPLRVERYAARPDRAARDTIGAARASSAMCACSASAPSWPRAWRTRSWRPTGWPGGMPGARGASS